MCLVFFVDLLFGVVCLDFSNIIMGLISNFSVRLVTNHSLLKLVLLLGFS